MELSERLLSRICVRGENECWPWIGAKDANGYGRLGKLLAHREVQKELQGADLKGVVIRNTCDNPICCNPSHHLNGTQKDNMQDMRTRGRHRDATRATHPMSVLTDEQTPDVFNATKTMSRRDVARAFGVSHGLVNRIVKRYRDGYYD